MRFYEVGAFQVRSLEVGALKVRSPEFGLFQVRSLEVGAFKVRFHEEGALKVNLDQVSTIQGSPGEADPILIQVLQGVLSSAVAGRASCRVDQVPGAVVAFLGAVAGFQEEALYRMRMPPKTIERAPAQRGGTRKTMNTEPGDKTVCFEMSITEEQERRIASWRRAQPDLPGRQEAIRKVLNRVLDEVETEDNGKS